MTDFGSRKAYPTPMIGDPVRFRRGDLDHEQRGRVVGRTICGAPRFDIEASDGALYQNLTDVRLD